MLKISVIILSLLCVYHAAARIKELEKSENLSFQNIIQSRSRQTKVCNLRCFSGRLVNNRCICRCWGNWVGPTCKERQCTTSFQHGCDANTRCVNKNKLCDGVQNCRDGTDEEGCSCFKKCRNGGKLDAASCTCSCTSLWTGDICMTPAASVHNKCGIRPVDSYRIVGGQVAGIEDHPWQVQLRYRFTGKHFYDFVCGGTLISSRYVVTAAHCVADKSTKQWRLYFGRKKRESGGEIIRNVAKVFIHEKYNFFTNNNDIALMVLSRPVIYSYWIQPACLHRLTDPYYQFNRESACFISGWGSLKYGGVLPYFLQAAQVVLIPQPQCVEIYEELTDKMICASESLQILGTVDTCQGDSGGPLVCASLDLHGFVRWHLVGITSFGYGCGEPKLPGVYTRVSMFIDWLNEKYNTPI